MVKYRKEVVNNNRGRKYFFCRLKCNLKNLPDTQAYYLC